MPKVKYTYRKRAKVHPSIDGILGLISFSTKIPVRRYVSIEKMSSSVILWPYIGLVIGAIGAIIAYVLEYLAFDQLLVAALVYCFLIWFTGYNHVDGVMDMGDGLMAHGDQKKRLAIMRDSTVGTGGISTFFIVAVITIAALATIPEGYLVSSIILMELCAKLSMLTSMVFGSSDKEGIGPEIKRGIDLKYLVVTIIICLVIATLLLGSTGVMVIFATIITGLYLSYVGEKSFGCVSGDILGASNEIAKAVALVFIILNLAII